MRAEDVMRFEDNNGREWDSDEINELTVPEIEELGLHLAEA